jgi:hypothetical protein
MTQTPSPGGSATPTPATPATGTPTTPGATPTVVTLTLEEALKKITELESHAQNKTEEASRHGAKLTAAEKELAAYKAAEQAARDAAMTETELLKKQASDLQAKQEELAAELYQARVFQDVSRLAGKFNFLVSADTLARMLLLDDDAIEFTDGKPQNIEKLLEKLAKSEPGLVKPADAQQSGAPALPGMNPGRSSITPPGAGATPGKKPSLFDPGLFKT